MDAFKQLPFETPVFNFPNSFPDFVFEGEEVFFDPDDAAPEVLVHEPRQSGTSQYVEAGGDDDVDILWLITLCDGYTSSNTSIFTSFQLCEEVLKITATAKASVSPEETMQSRLFELLGENGFDVMIELMQKMSSLFQMDAVDLKLYQDDSGACGSSGKGSGGGGGSGRQKELSINQRKKLERKQEKERLARIANGDTYGGQSLDWLASAGFSEDYLEQERMLGLQGGGIRGAASVDNWRDNLAPEGTLVYHEQRSALPAGSEKKFGPGYEEVHIPAHKKVDQVLPGGLIAVDSLEGWAQLAFPRMSTLNRIQSEVFPAAYNSGENLLICAPTGAGKTNIAMLAFLQLVKQNIADGELNREGVKAIYIAPMKALAQEVVSKFRERLDPLGLVVKEYTGDMQLSKQEVADSNLLVTTPEKYDVVTRKGGDGSLGTLVSLIIIDEVHLLADDRGAVIETIVARTQRYIESAQRMIRIVGLSATLPNYEDVASFLKVNMNTGLFFFGPEYRPVPLEQTFLGVTEKQRFKQKDAMNRLAYEKMVAALERGKQVMIFVHSRKETSTTAEAMRDLAARGGTSHLLDNVQHEKFGLWKRQVDKSRSREVQNFFYQGFGTHHAGMLRADRTMTEELFEQGLIKVLCCTATLAWGVNLPAHTVIIKGTEMYDPERGGIVDVSILDVVQIFGRAGRPQYDNTGHAILITTQKSLSNYLSLLSLQTPIESGFIKALADHLNAEIVNGTVNNVKEAMSWLTYTFLFVRMCRNPVAYGLSFEERFSDPQLDRRRNELIRQAAQVLDNCMMARYDPRSGNLAVTDLGRVASHYYIKHDTIEAFNSMLSAHLSDSDALHVLCSSTEFDQLKIRPEELEEIDRLKKEAAVEIRGPVEETSGKVSALLQGYLGQSKVNSFTLQSDTNYVAQNAGRICRALFEICLKRGWSTMATRYLNLCKSIDRRVRPDQSPLRQFVYDELPRDALKRMEQLNVSVNTLFDMNASEIGQLCHSQKSGGKILSLVQRLPHLHIDCVAQPITRGVIKLLLDVSADFEWSDRYHGLAEPFWIWIEDGENEYIYHAEKFILSKRQRSEVQRLEFIIPIREPLPPQYYVRAISDRWSGCASAVAVSFQHLILPDRMPPHTDLLDMHPVPRSALQNPKYEALYKFSHFNPIQSQTFHALYHTDVNVLVGAPTGSGKTILAELALLRLKNKRPGAKAIYVAPLKALARERLQDWQRKLGQGLGMVVLELTGDITPDLAALARADLLIVTPEKWDSISRGWQKREYVQRVELVIIDEIHLLGVDRGPVLEVIVSRMRFISCQTSKPIRFVGLSTALANPRDLADWLGIGQVGVYNFRPSVRPIPMTIHIQGFPGAAYCPRMATMNKPAYAAIQEHSPKKPVLIFVSSRRQTRLTALDLISYCAAEDNPKQFLHMPEEEVADLASTFRDKALRDTILFGVAIHHAGLDTHDRNSVEELFLNGKVQVLVCTSTLAWGVNLPCHLVIVKGTEFFDGKIGRYVDMPVTDVLQMIGRAGRPQFDDTGVACVFVHEPKKNFYRKFLHEPFPVESSLHQQLHEHINAEVVAGVVNCMQDCLEYITWTYYFRRLVMNPSYYRLEDFSPAGVQRHLTALLSDVVMDLQRAGCLDILEDESYQPTALGKIVAFYYLDYRTVGQLKTGILAIDATTSTSTSTARGSGHGAGSQPQELIKLTRLLCDAFEFSELPVRHNEDGLNGDLSEQCPWPVDPDTLGEPHTKAFLLMQAHFFRVSLPIVDYVTDTKSVLDQMPRVLNAALDIAADLGCLKTVLWLAKISKMIFQGCGFQPDELSQLPGSDQDRQTLRRVGIKTIQDLKTRLEGDLDPINSTYTTDGAAAGAGRGGGRGDRGGGGRGGGGRGRGTLPLPRSHELISAVGNLPLLSILLQYRLASTPSAMLAQLALDLKLLLQPSVADQPPGDWMSLSGVRACVSSAVVTTSVSTSISTSASTSASTSVDASAPSLPTADLALSVISGVTAHRRLCSLKVNLVRPQSLLAHGQGGGGRRGSNLHTPHYHKPKVPSWWLVVGVPVTGELLALKKIGVLNRSESQTDVEFALPVPPAACAAAAGMEVSVYLVCDSVFGLDQVLTFFIEGK